MVSSVQASSWERPDLGFEAFVARLVQSRLHKYARTDHPFHISAAAAAQLFKKARRTIIDNERQVRVFASASHTAALSRPFHMAHMYATFDVNCVSPANYA